MTLPVVTTADADAYFATTPRSAEWIAVADPEIWLSEAQRWLGALCYDQTKDCCGRSFSAAWAEAVSELALALSKSPTALVGGAATAATGAVQTQTLGDLSISYFNPADGGNTVARYGPQAPLVLQKFPWIGDVIGCWLNVATGGARIVARVRS